MKSFVTILFLAFSFTLAAQPPQSFKYQAIAREVSSGEVLENKSLILRLSILKGNETGPAQYVETHSVTTNQNGLMSVNIGDGSVSSGMFDTIPWGADDYFLKVEIDPESDNTFEWLGTSQLLSVPYALMAGDVKDGAVTSEKIALDAVSDSNIVNESGINFLNGLSDGIVKGTVTTAWDTVRSVNITCPGSGYVVCIATGYVDYDDFTFTSSTRLGWDEDENTFAPNTYVWATNPNPGDNSHIPYTAMYTFPVDSAGDYRYYLKASLFTGTGDEVDVYVNSASVMYFPTRY
jgi:hypothetical protein